METNDVNSLTETIPAAEVPEKTLHMIRNAWIAALVSAGITFVITLIAISGAPILGFSAWELIDVALVLGLAFGIYKKSRACAVIMLGYFVLAKILLAMAVGTLAGLPMALVFIYFYWQGVVGTFAYHKWKRKGNAEPLTA